MTGTPLLGAFAPGVLRNDGVLVKEHRPGKRRRWPSMGGVAIGPVEIAPGGNITACGLCGGKGPARSGAGVARNGSPGGGSRGDFGAHSVLPAKVPSRAESVLRARRIVAPVL